MSRWRADRAQAALLRALLPVAGPFTVIVARSGTWSSATFEGASHRLALRIDGKDGDRRAAVLSATLAEIDIPMRGAFVADIAVTVRMQDGAPILGIEALTIEDAVEDPAPVPAISRAGRRAG